MTIIILMGLIVAGLLTSSAILYFTLLSPAAQERLKLGRQARLDYEHARGTAHLQMMRSAHARHLRAYQFCQDALENERRQQAAIHIKRDTDLWRALESHLLQTRLEEIPGIGPMLAAQLQQYAQMGRGLPSLRSASGRVPGIGYARQAAINAWVDSIEANKRTLLSGDFPGKVEIEKQAAAGLEAVGTRIGRLSAEESVQAARLDRLQCEINTLANVTPNTFYLALRGSAPDAEAVGRYLNGVFAAWEPVPDWFKECVEEAQS